MQCKFLPFSCSRALSFVLIGSVFWFACSRPKPTQKRGAVLTNVASSSSAAAPSAAVTARDICERAADRCGCAAEQGEKLLTASFPERALQIVSRAPESCATPALLAARAEALAAVERGPEAASLATSVLAGDPKNRFARRALAITFLQKGELAAANAILSQLVDEDAKDADSLFYEALIQRKGDHFNLAREGFLHVLRINSQHVDARYNLVTLTASAGAAQEAEHHYQELLQIAPVGDARLIAARTALHRDAPTGPTELPVLHQSSRATPSSTSSAPSIAPTR